MRLSLSHDRATRRSVPSRGMILEWASSRWDRGSLADRTATFWRLAWKVSGRSAQLNAARPACGHLHGSKRNSDLIAVARITRLNEREAVRPACELIRCTATLHRRVIALALATNSVAVAPASQQRADPSELRRVLFPTRETAP